MFLKNAKGEEINTKEKAIIALVHTSNYEQVPIKNIWCLDEQCKLFNINPDGFYKQEVCEECSTYGIEIYHYKDDEFEYKYEWTHC